MIESAADYAITSIAVVASSILVYVAGKRERRGSVTVTPQPVEVDLRPMCTCTHWFNMHEDNGGPCVVQEKEYFDGKQKWIDCPCMHYLGPDPQLTGMWSVPKKEKSEKE